MKKITGLLFVFTVIVLSQPSNAESKWKLVKSKNGINGYVRNVEGSYFKATRVVMTIKASFSEVVSMMTDVNAYRKWYPDLKKLKVLKTINKNERYIYLIFDAPWPISDREVVNRFTVTRKADRTFLRFRQVNSSYTENSKAVKMKKVTGVFEMIKQKNGTTKVIYETHGEPGGRFPSWLVNKVCMDRPVETFELMIKYLNRHKNSSVARK